MANVQGQAASAYFLQFKAEVQNKCLFSYWWTDLHKNVRVTKHSFKARVQS